MSVGRNIKRLRLEAGISTPRAFAERLGVLDAQLSDWENDRYVLLRVPTLVRIAKVLRCSVEDLLEGVDPEYDRARGVVRLRAHSRFPGHALTPTGVMAIRCKQFHLPDL